MNPLRMLGRMRAKAKARVEAKAEARAKARAEAGKIPYKQLAETFRELVGKGSLSARFTEVIDKVRFTPYNQFSPTHQRRVIKVIQDWTEPAAKLSDNPEKFKTMIDDLLSDAIVSKDLGDASVLIDTAYNHIHNIMSVDSIKKLRPLVNKYGSEKMINAAKRTTGLASEQKEMLIDWLEHKAFWGAGAIVGAFAIADMLRPEEAEAIPVTAAVRASILQRMATTPEREALLAKAIPRLEEELKAPGIKRAFVGGSFVTRKPAPSDLDIFVQGPEYTEFFRRRLLTGKTEELPLFPPLHVTPTSGIHPPETKRFGEAAKDFLASARKKYGLDHHWKRIFSAAGLAAGASVLAPEEAEAFPIKEIVKSGKRAMLKVPSSAERDLIGKDIGGRTVTGVRWMRGGWRRVYFSDGTEVDLTKDYLNSLMRATGTRAYMREFMAQPARGRQSMAAASLSKRLDMIDIPISEHVKRHKEHMTRLNQMERVLNLSPGSLVTEGVWVRYPRGSPDARVFQMPKLYADELEKAGEITILRKEPK